MTAPRPASHVSAPIDRRWLTAVYVSAAVACTVIGLRIGETPLDSTNAHLVDAAALALLLLSYRWRRRGPTLVFTLSVALVLVDMLVTAAVGMGLVVLLTDIVFHLAVQRRARWIDVLGFGGGALVLLALLLEAAGVVPASPLIPVLLVITTSIWWGRSVQAPLVESELLRERAVRIEAEAAQARHRAIAEERLLIGRELHDAVSGNIAAIALRATAAQRRRSGHGPTDDTVDAIRAAAVESLDQLRSFVHVLSRGDGVAERSSAEDRVANVIDHARTLGLAVTADVPTDAALAVLDRRSRRAAARIVQEALMNALTHGTGTADLALTVDPTTLRIRVENPVRAVANDIVAGGMGVTGMIERVRLLGGHTLHTGARTQNGASWLWECTIPCHPEA